MKQRTLHETVKTKQISDKVAVYTETAEEICDNGQEGDKRISLHIARIAEFKTIFLNYAVGYLETNGDPILITEDNIRECSQLLGLKKKELKILLSRAAKKYEPIKR